jgi:Flp pilus assembly protein TadG
MIRLNPIRRRRQRGAALIELAVSVLVLFFVVFWTWELVMAVYTYAVLSDAAKEGVRYAIVHGIDVGTGNCSGPGCTDASGTNVANVVRDYAQYALHDMSAMTVTVNYPETAVTYSQSGGLVTVNVSYTYVPWVKLAWTPPALVTGAQGRIVW